MGCMNVITKRILLYTLGLFTLSFGVSLSIQADLGVSPVSSLAYALTLTSKLSIGVTTVLTNILYILLQIVIHRRVDLKDFVLQLMVSFMYGFFMDATLFIVKLLPTPEILFARYAYLIISLFVVACGLLCYLTAKLPLLPFDALTYAVSERFGVQFGKAKISSDLVNASISGVICLLFIQSLGSIGIGTLIAAYFLGRIIGWMMQRWQQRLKSWMHGNKVL